LDRARIAAFPDAARQRRRPAAPGNPAAARVSEDLLDLKARIQSDGQLIHATVLHLDVFIPNEATAEAAATADASTSLEQAPGQTVFDGQIAPEASTRTSTGRAGTSPARPRRSELGDELMPLVELRERHTDHEEHAVQNTEFHEANALEPPAGALLALRPGETLLLRFAFLNESERARTYVLEDDRSLDVEWLTMVQDEVNISRDQSDELSMRLHPPPAARPGDYPFSVRLGPEGGTLLGRELTLRILAAPAVALKCAAPRLVVGPFKRRIDFALSVETAGNADTAFRLSTHTPLVEYKGRTWRRRDRQAERDAQNPERREGQVLAAVKKTEKPVTSSRKTLPKYLKRAPHGAPSTNRGAGRMRSITNWTRWNRSRPTGRPRRARFACGSRAKVCGGGASVKASACACRWCRSPMKTTAGGKATRSKSRRCAGGRGRCRCACCCHLEFCRCCF
jgi:hypothetical protein